MSTATTAELKLSYPPDVEEYIAQQIAEGRFRSESELAAAAIEVVRQLESCDRDFRAQLKRSIEQADRGEVAALDTEATLREARRRFLTDQ